MRKIANLMTVLTLLLVCMSVILIAPVFAIGEITPTPISADPTQEPAEEIDVEALIQEGLAAIQNGEYRSALATMDIVIELDQTQATAYVVRAIANNQLGFTQDAIADFSSAIELEPWEQTYYSLRASVYAESGDLTEALLDFDQAINITPIAPDLYVRRSNVYYELGDSTAGDVDDLIARALEALAANDSTSAYAFLDEAIDLGEGLDSLAFAYYVRAIVSLNISDTNAALDDYESVLEINPDFHVAYLARGIQYRQDGDLQAAGEDFYNRITIHGNETVQEEMEIGETLELGMAYRRVIEVSFDGEEGQVISIMVDEFSGTGTSDPLIALLSPDNTPIAGDDDSGEVLNSLIRDFKLPEDGTYTLLISHAEGGYAFGFQGLIEVTIEE